jgi:hypothetical protein
MPKARTTKWRKASTPTLHRAELEKLLEILSACDRGVVEFSMGLYNVPRSDRVTLRRQNRRLHRALKSYLPQLLQPQQPFFELSDTR